MTKEEFLQITIVLEKNYDKQIDRDILKLWYREFKNLSRVQYQKLVIEAIRKYKFLPTLAEMIKIEVIPDWFDKEIKKREPSEEEKEEMKNLLKEFK